MLATPLKWTANLSIIASDSDDRDQQGYDYGGNGYSNHRRSEPATECVPPAPKGESGGQPAGAAQPPGAAAPPAGGAPPPAAGAPNGAEQTGANPSGPPVDNTPSISAAKLHALVQHIYAAQARVQLEANEIKKAQGVAASAQKSLEEAANNVRVITAALQTAQQEVATAAVRAQTAQMQLAAHDQLLFAARQKVDALSSQMVGLQAEDGIIAPKAVINVQALLSQLKQPLPQNQTPTPIPPVDGAAKAEGQLKYDYLDYYE